MAMTVRQARALGLLRQPSDNKRLQERRAVIASALEWQELRLAAMAQKAESRHDLSSSLKPRLRLQALCCLRRLGIAATRRTGGP